MNVVIPHTCNEPVWLANRVWGLKFKSHSCRVALSFGLPHKAVERTTLSSLEERENYTVYTQKKTILNIR